MPRNILVSLRVKPKRFITTVKGKDFFTLTIYLHTSFPQLVAFLKVITLNSGTNVSTTKTHSNVENALMNLYFKTFF